MTEAVGSFSEGKQYPYFLVLKNQSRHITYSSANMFTMKTIHTNTWLWLWQLKGFLWRIINYLKKKIKNSPFSPLPHLFLSKYYLFFPMAFLRCEYKLVLSSHVLIGHQNAENTQWSEQRHFRALSPLDISCHSIPLPHLIVSLAGHKSPLEHSKSCCFQTKFVSAEEINHYNCLET